MVAGPAKRKLNTVKTLNGIQYHVSDSMMKYAVHIKYIQFIINNNMRAWSDGSSDNTKRVYKSPMEITLT